MKRETHRNLSHVGGGSQSDKIRVFAVSGRERERARLCVICSVVAACRA